MARSYYTGTINGRKGCIRLSVNTDITDKSYYEVESIIIDAISDIYTDINSLQFNLKESAEVEKSEIDFWIVAELYKTGHGSVSIKDMRNNEEIIATHRLIPK